MASTTLDKKIKEPAIPAARAELAGAIERRRQCDAAVAAKLESIARAHAGEAAALADVEKCRAAVSKARDADAAGAATNIDKGKAPAAAWHFASAISNVARAERDLEVAIAARERLEEDLVDLQIDAAAAKNAVVVAATKVAAPLFAARMTQIRELRVQLLMERVALCVLMADTAVEFPDDARSFFPARSAEAARVKAREAACGAFAREAETDGAYLAVMPAAHSAEEYSRVLEAAAKWKLALARLLEDASAKLPGEN